MITLEEIQKRVAEIREKIQDDGMAHTLEDDLWKDVLEDIASADLFQKRSVKDLQALAREALKTTEIDFNRWCE